MYIGLPEHSLFSRWEEIMINNKKYFGHLNEYMIIFILNIKTAK